MVFFDLFALCWASSERQLKMYKPNSGFLTRLRTAGWKEMAYRTGHLLEDRRLKKQLARGEDIIRNIPELKETSIAPLQLPELRLDLTPNVIEALRMGKKFVLNGDPDKIHAFEVKFRPRFCRDLGFGKERTDIRMVWEAGRLQNLLILLVNGQLSENRDDVLLAVRSALYWIDKNPFLRGTHFLSPMECGLRLPLFFFALKALSPEQAKERKGLGRAIYEHGWWIARRLALYSSLGNHTISEAAGLIFAGAVFRDFEAGKEWLEIGVRLLRQEAFHQILEDGGPVEQSLRYHRMVLDLYWLALDFCNRNKLADFSFIQDRLEAGERFLAAFGATEEWPLLGDSDDGWALGPGLHPKRFRVDPPEQTVLSFPHAGYTVYRFKRNAQMVFDHGPLGMAPLYNHGHADALSISLRFEGRPILVDAGTYRYNGVQEWRHYFKSTRAHNTVTIDDQDQAVQETGFVWSRPFNAKLLSMAEDREGFLLKASHDGYRRLKPGVVHERSVRVSDDGTILIRDRFEGKGIHFFEMNFHFHPDCSVKPESDCWQIENGPAQLTFQVFPERFRGRVVAGCENPILGWFSPGYGLKIPCPVLNVSREGRPDDISFLTVISGRGPLNEELVQKRADTL